MLLLFAASPVDCGGMVWLTVNSSGPHFFFVFQSGCMGLIVSILNCVVSNCTCTGKKSNDLATFVEARLGKPSHLLEGDKLKQFLGNNGKVLRFWCVWDDRQGMYGDRRPYVLHFYLEDDTIEINEVRAAAAACLHTQSSSGWQPVLSMCPQPAIYINIRNAIWMDSTVSKLGVWRPLVKPPRPL